MRLLGGIVLMLSVLSGCVGEPRQPKLFNPTISQSRLAPGETAIVTVEIRDKFGVVDRVDGIVKEDATITFRLKDDGIPPDREADDGVWTIQVDVPFNAPPGDFEFEITGYDSNGNIVVIRDELNEAAPLSTSFEVQIRYGDEARRSDP